MNCVVITSSFTRKMMMASEPANGNSLPSVILGSSSTVGTSSASKSTSSLTLREQQHHQNVEGVKERKERQMRRLAAEMDDQRSKFERDKVEALNHQKEAMNRAFRVQLAKLLKEKEELQRKCQTLMQQSKEPNGKIQSNGMTTAAASQAAAETMKLIHENAILRNEKKKQEEQLQMMKESEQHRFENMRSLLDDKARELITFQKQLRQQIARLVERGRQREVGKELESLTQLPLLLRGFLLLMGMKENREESKTKDRVISHLESELRMQTGRAQQFRDILEQSLLTSNRCSISKNEAMSNAFITNSRHIQPDG
ncbi:hypothetical protein OUZ56_004765 [Daphnia magna]|uniref:Uncharacterized protein n=1 Tax=Daphnia magna TaxID=35525 RepID=A0ABQ9YQS4_9CRUS|nr:hypothetical protein OUZ56_004765 [Daphnia magna]